MGGEGIPKTRCAREEGRVEVSFVQVESISLERVSRVHGIGVLNRRLADFSGL